jgi:hypothetical protein
MREAPIAKIEQRLSLPESKTRDRGALSEREFKNLARQIWPPVKRSEEHDVKRNQGAN